jgi:hypothetical protein
MTSEALSRSFPHANAHLWRAVAADLAFWTAAGLLAALLSVPIGNLIDVRPLWFAVGAAGLAAFSVGSLFVLDRMRPVSRRLVWGFALGNLAGAPVAWLAAFLGWLPLSAAGNWGLAMCADAAFILGLYQLYVVRQRTG